MKNAISTVGLSAYNVIANNGGPMHAGKCFSVVKGGLNDETLTEEEFVVSLSELAARGRVRIVDQAKALVDVTDPLRRVVKWRDRTKDGWTRWMVPSEQGPVVLKENRA